MRSFLVCVSIFFSYFAHADTWIVKSPKKLSLRTLRTKGCSYRLLNPHIGSDIYSAKCPEFISVSNAERNHIWKPFSLQNKYDIGTNDPRNIDQWGLDTMNVPAFWKKFSTGDSRVRVAIIDTGINYNHEDLKNNLMINTGEIPDNGIDDDKNGYIDDFYGWNAGNNSSDPMDKFDHGTHVAGIIGASTNNNIGISGVNWNVSMIPIKFTNDDGSGSTESAISAIDYAVARGAQIINASWGGSEHSPLLEETFGRCRALGILVIAAAGNETADNDKVPSYPANFPLDNIISVTAIDINRDLSWFSNWGEKTVHIAAPGESILSTVANNRYGYKDGTSMAVPHITGAAALLWSIHPKWTYIDIKNHLLSHCVVDKAHPIPVVCQGYFSFLSE